MTKMSGRKKMIGGKIGSILLICAMIGSTLIAGLPLQVKGAIADDGIWVPPTGHVNNDWKDEGDAHDDDTASYAYYNKIGDSGWSNDYLILTLDWPILCSKVRYWAKSGDNLDQIDVDVWYSNSWHHVYTGSNFGEHWTEKSIPGGEHEVSKARIRFHLSSGTFGQPFPHWAKVYEFQFNIELKPGDIIQLRNDSYEKEWNLFYWTHTVLYIGFNENTGKHEVIHSSKWNEEDKRYECGIEPLEEVKKRVGPDNCVYLRANPNANLDENEINAIISFAEDKTDPPRPYDTWSIPNILPIHCTKQVNPSDDPDWETRYGYYCTELVWAAYINETDEPNINLDANDQVDNWREDPGIQGDWETLINPWEIYTNDYLDKIYVRHPDEVESPSA